MLMSLQEGPTRGNPMNEEQAKEWIMKISYAVRHNSMRRIVRRRMRKEKYTNLYLIPLLVYAKRDFDAEVTLIKRYKEKVESEIGQSLGTVIDPDGRQI